MRGLMSPRQKSTLIKGLPHLTTRGVQKEPVKGERQEKE